MITAPRLGELGQLGNQIFQFATLIGVAEKNNYDYFIPLESLDHRGQCYDFNKKERFSYKISLLDCFDIEAPIISLNKFRFSNFYSEKNHNFDPDMFNISDNSYIAGQFETEKYFEHCKDLIFNVLKFKPEIEDISKKRIDQINLNVKKLLSVHVRRGQDRPEIQDYHPFLPKEYYDNCLKHFNPDEWKVIVFTDDMDWSKKNIIFEDIHFHEWCTEYSRPDFIDLCMMTYCDSHIIANSTFSWWGAWLSKNKTHQVVYAPKLWFGPALSNKNTDDIIPERWKRIY